MKTLNYYCLLLLLLTATFQVLAQKVKTKAEKTIELVMTSTGGTNGGAVAYHPVRDQYYAAFAGNESYPLEVFDSKGQQIAASTPGFDVRGLWYNPKSEKLEGNSFDDKGLFRIKWNPAYRSTPYTTNIWKGLNQPHENSVGSFDAKKNELVFMHEGFIYRHNAKSGALVRKFELENTPAQKAMNLTTGIFTGVKKHEYILLNVAASEVFFFNKKGKLTATCKLPGNQKLEDYFNWSYANGQVWIFNIESRTWTGYRVFDK